MKQKTLMMSLIALLLSMPAHAFFLCANKTTQAVRYPTNQKHCTAAEIPLSTVPSVVDSTGHVVGPLTSAGVLFNISGTLTSVSVGRAGFITGGALLYASTDCSGQAMVPTLIDEFYATTQNEGETLYYGNPLVAKAVTINSALDFTGPFAGVCQTEVEPVPTNAAPALSVPVSTLGTFQPPFHLQ